MTKIGPFNRRESTSQTSETALKQEASGEVWGRTPRGGIEPTVQAYPYALAKESRGIQFTTEIMPHPNGSPLQVRWYLTRTPGVQLRNEDGEDFACVTADVENRQKYK